MNDCKSLIALIIGCYDFEFCQIWNVKPSLVLHLNHSNGNNVPLGLAVAKSCEVQNCIEADIVARTEFAKSLNLIH